ncbi:hypothetical protein GVAMD_0838 [Gardnerella vaginalis AMD]|nr:hypothetical protein GVAMD_0838 [Gardnerella vaginalis AMD]
MYGGYVSVKIAIFKVSSGCIHACVASLLRKYLVYSIVPHVVNFNAILVQF